MIFPELIQYTDLALFLLRLIVATVFIASGWKHLTNTKARAENIGMPVWFTFLLGIVEFFGSLMLVLGVFVQIAAIGLIAVMLGAVYKKAFVWKTGFWGQGSQGWHYDLLLLIANLVILTTSGGSWIIS